MMCPICLSKAFDGLRIGSSLLGWWLRRRGLLGSTLRPWEIPFFHLSVYSRERWIVPTALKEILKNFSSFALRVVFI
jgi:hypothetical protein